MFNGRTPILAITTKYDLLLSALMQGDSPRWWEVGAKNGTNYLRFKQIKNPKLFPLNLILNLISNRNWLAYKKSQRTYLAVNFHEARRVLVVLLKYCLSISMSTTTSEQRFFPVFFISSSYFF